MMHSDVKYLTFASIYLVVSNLYYYATCFMCCRLFLPLCAADVISDLCSQIVLIHNACELRDLYIVSY